MCLEDKNIVITSALRTAIGTFRGSLKKKQAHELANKLGPDVVPFYADVSSKDDVIELNKNIFYGYGSMGDRFLIGQTASNGFIYVYSSSGIIGLIFFTMKVTIMKI